MTSANLVNNVIYAPGYLWLDPDNGAINLASYPDNMTGTYLGEVTTPIVMSYNPIKTALVIDQYGDTIVDYRDVSCEFSFNAQLAEMSVASKEMFWGDARVTTTGGIELPGAAADNSSLSAPTHKILFVTKASIYSKTTAAAYKWNIFIPRCQPKPVDGATVSLGNEYSNLEVDFIATFKENASAGNQSKRLAQVDAIANITVF